MVSASINYSPTRQSKKLIDVIASLTTDVVDFEVVISNYSIEFNFVYYVKE